MKRPTPLYRCPTCLAEFETCLCAHNPFDPQDAVLGCPECKDVIEPSALCDEDGCDDEPSSGWLSKRDGYRRTCHEHWVQLKEEHA